MAKHFAVVHASTVREWLNDGNEIALFDVREAGEFGEGHPFFAIPLPYSRLELDVARLAPQRKVRTVLLDNGANGEAIAQLAARRLADLGYTDLFVLEGGAPGWDMAGYTLFKGVNVPSKTFGELVEHAYGTPRISAVELARQQAEGVPLVLLDGRTVEEHTKMTIPGAVNCPNGELAYRIGAFATNPHTPIVIHCAGRTRSIIGAQLLRSFGVPNPVVALENGTQGWVLAGLKLEHGSARRFPDEIDEAALTQARQRSAALAERFSLTTLDRAAAQTWLDNPDRTTYLLDVRNAVEYARDGVTAATHAPGGQLLQATDQTIGVRHARVLLVDHDEVRAPVIASWLTQLGLETALVAAREAQTLRRASAAESVERGSSSWQPIWLDENALRELSALKTKHLLDLRASAAYRKEHASGARWSIRPRLLDALAAAGHADPIVLFADSTSLAILAARDLHDAGFTSVSVVAGGYASWARAGLPVESSPDAPADNERIDHLFFVHDRHEGNLESARAYLAWETGLIAQCAPDELGQFRIRASTNASAPSY